MTWDDLLKTLGLGAGVVGELTSDPRITAQTQNQTGTTTQNQTGTTSGLSQGSTTGTTAGTSAQAESGSSGGQTASSSAGETTTSNISGGPAWWEARQQDLSQKAAQLPGYQAYFDGNRPVVGQFSDLESEAVGKGREAGKSILDMGIEKYMNPYLENVLNPQMRRLGEDQALQQQQNAAQRVARGGFGTARADLLQNQMAERQTLERQEALNKGYFNAYNNATNLAAGDAERMRQSGQFLANMGATQRGIDDTAIQRQFQEWQTLQNDPRTRLQAEAGVVSGLRPANISSGATTNLNTGATGTLNTNVGQQAGGTTGTTTGSTLNTTTGTSNATGTTTQNLSGTGSTTMSPLNDWQKIAGVLNTAGNSTPA